MPGKPKIWNVLWDVQWLNIVVSGEEINTVVFCKENCLPSVIYGNLVPRWDCFNWKATSAAPSAQKGNPVYTSFIKKEDQCFFAPEVYFLLLSQNSGAEQTDFSLSLTFYLQAFSPFVLKLLMHPFYSVCHPCICPWLNVAISLFPTLNDRMHTCL